jgi:hypothetical protein
MTRRVVRIAPEFFASLDSQLPNERGPAGEPTAAEFAASDLLDIVDAFATLWDELPMPIQGQGRSDYRDMILKVRLVPYVLVRGQISPVDGAVELIDIEIDLAGLPPADTDTEED